MSISTPNCYWAGMSQRMHSITRMPGINTDILNGLSIEYMCVTAILQIKYTIYIIFGCYWLVRGIAEKAFMTLFFFTASYKNEMDFKLKKKKSPLQQSTVTGHSFKQKTLLHSIAFPLTLIDEQRHNIDAKLEEKTLYFVSPGKLPNFSQVCSQWKAVQMHVSTTKPSEGLCILISFFTYVGKLMFLSCK